MEFPTLGQQCAQEGCAQLDFLPMQCAHCHLTFCKDHHQPANHVCQFVKDNVVTDEDLEGMKREKWQQRCTFPGCRAKELVEIQCVKCKGHFCVSHRHCDQHQCVADIKPSTSTLVEKKAMAKEVLDKVKESVNTKLEEAKGAGGAKGAMASKLALMKLKGRAKGDGSVPQSERVFFTVECPNKQQNPQPLDLYMGKPWTMGKAVDFVARQARIKNRNNIPDAPKLHLFKGDVCLSTPFDRSITELLNEEIIVDGDALKFDYLPA